MEKDIRRFPQVEKMLVLWIPESEEVRSMLFNVFLASGLAEVIEQDSRSPVQLIQNMEDQIGQRGISGSNPRLLDSYKTPYLRPRMITALYPDKTTGLVSSLESIGYMLDRIVNQQKSTRESALIAAGYDPDKVSRIEQDREFFLNKLLFAEQCLVGQLPQDWSICIKDINPTPALVQVLKDLYGEFPQDKTVQNILDDILKAAKETGNERKLKHIASK